MVTLGNDMGRDGIEITPERIYEFVKMQGILPTTSALNVADYDEYFREELRTHDALVHITIGAGFSSCYQNACIAAEGMENVFIVDSRNLSAGQGQIVMEAAIRAKNCETIEDVAKLAEELRVMTPQVEASFVLDKLDYMRKGGRCSMATALGAAMLNIKPCIEVKDGEMIVAKKYRGSLEKALKHYLTDRLENRDDILKDRIFIVDSGIAPAYLAMARTLAQECGFGEILETKAGSTVSCHCGDNTLGIFFLRKQETV